MKMVRLISNRRYDVLLVILLAFFPLFKYSIISFISLTLLIVSFYYFKTSPTRFERMHLNKRTLYFFASIGYYLILIFSLAYTTNISAGLREVQHGVYILLFPLVFFFFLPPLSESQIRSILYSFVTSCTIYLGYLQYFFYKADLYSNYRETKIDDLPFRDVLMNLQWGSGHPTYVSMWFLFSALFLIYILLKGYIFSILKRILIIVDIFLLVITSIMLSSKITFVAFTLSVAFILFLTLKNKFWLFITLSSIGFLFFILVFNISFLKARFIDEYKITELKPPIGIQTNSLNIRVGIYECAIEVFSKNWLIGTGVGDVQDKLNKCYEKFDTDVYQKETFNSHNNYFQTALSTGIIGLISFLLMFSFNIKESVKHENTFFLVFIVFFMICMIPENILSRNSGVVFYSFFGSLFMKQNLENSILKDSREINEVPKS
jgi:O-antigen ligase